MKRITVLLLVTLGLNGLSQEYMTIHLNSGNTVSYLTSDIQSITFDEEIINPTDSNVVAYYPFNGNANDESGNGNHGMVYGATPAPDRFGVNNMAYSFDGVNDVIEVPDDDALDFGPEDDITFCLWVKCSIQNVPEYWYIPTFYKTQANPYLGYTFGTIYTLTAAEITTTGGRVTADDGDLSGLSQINNNIWNFLCLVINRNQQKAEIFVNGTLEKTIINGAFGNYTMANSGNFYIGSTSISADRYFYGALDDIRLYKRALTPSEIMELYQLDQ